LKKALADTKAIRWAEAEAAWLERCKAEEPTFVPFLYAEGQDSIPHGICIFAMSGGHQRWTIIRISPTTLALPLEEQLAALPELALCYKKQYNGAVPFVGRLKGFKYLRCMDYFQFDAEGHLVEHVNRPFRRGGCWLELR